MRIKSVMTKDVATCKPDDRMSTAYRVMWERDCGIVPVVHADSGRLEGIVTDRDLCMAALLSNRPPERIPVREVMATTVHTCTEDDDLKAAHATMRENQIRRLPVVDGEGHLTGLLSLNDLAVEAFESRSNAATRRQRDIARTLAAISTHRNAVEEED